MAYAKKVDQNQQYIIAMLEQVGASVESLHRVGGGVPDLLVGFRGQTYLIEIKTDAGRLNDIQRTWHATWRGRVAVVRSPDEALRAIGAIE